MRKTLLKIMILRKKSNESYDGPHFLISPGPLKVLRLCPECNVLFECEWPMDNIIWPPLLSRFIVEPNIQPNTNIMKESNTSRSSRFFDPERNL